MKRLEAIPFTVSVVISIMLNISAAPIWDLAISIMLTANLHTVNNIITLHCTHIKHDVNRYAHCEWTPRLVVVF